MSVNGKQDYHVLLAERRWIRLSWRLSAISLVLLFLVAGYDVLVAGTTPELIAVAVLAALAGVGLLVNLAAVSGWTKVRTEQEASLTRILRGLSRSVSPDAVVAAILDELRGAAGADHVVVARVLPGGTAVQATLVSSNAAVPVSVVRFPLPTLSAVQDESGRVGVPVAPAIVGRDLVSAAAGLVPVVARPRSAGSVGTVPGLRKSAGSVGTVPGLRKSAGSVGTVTEPRRSVGWTTFARAFSPRAGGDLARAGDGGERNVTAARAGDLARAGDGGERNVTAAQAGDRARAADGGARNVTAAQAADGGARNVTAARASAGDRHGFRGAALAQRIADRVRIAYGLQHLLSVPLVSDAGVVGALVLSRRRDEPWSVESQRLLDDAAQEVAAALARAYAHEEVEARASTDALTGLPNRGYFDELSEVLGRGRRATDSLGMLMIDIDHFKRFNDRYGHAIGDAVLRAVAQAVAGSVRADDVPARYGGEEFVVVLRRASSDQVVEVAERVRAAVGSVDLSAVGISGRVSVSVGAAVGRGEAPVEIVRRADTALLEAKRLGRDRVVVG